MQTRSIGPFVLILLAMSGCVKRSDYDQQVKETEAAKQEAEASKTKLAQVQQQLNDDEQQIGQLKSSLGIAQSQAMTDDQKSQLEEAKRAVQEAQDRAKLLTDLEAKFKRLIDAGHLKVTTRHGRIVLQLHNDVLFDTGAADVNAAGKQAIGQVAATLRSVGGRRFQVAGHTDNAPITTETKKSFPTNWELSTARAIAVVKLLVSEGVDPGELSAAGYGPYDPIAPNSTPDGQAKNRRIEITLVPNVAPLVAAAAKAPQATASATP
jgi:chemotaxis protein MotB